MDIPARLQNITLRLQRLEEQSDNGGGGGTAGVISFKGRTGAVLPQSGDYTTAMVAPTAPNRLYVTQAEKDLWNAGGGGGQEVNSLSAEQILTDGPNVIWDMALGTHAVVTIAGNRTLVILNATGTFNGMLTVIQGTGGFHTLALPGTKPADYVLSSQEGQYDLLGFENNSQGMFWDFRNYGTVAILPTLLAPTNFTAGTPTFAGCPFTWGDPNTTPNESGFLIQIAAFADTAYATFVTVNAAANATSAPASSNLAALTQYRARICALGTPAVSNNSPFSNEVIFTTADLTVGAELPLNFAGSSGIIAHGTEANTWVFKPGGAADWGNLGKANAFAPGSGSARLFMDVVSGGSDQAVLGFHTINAEVPHTTMVAGFSVNLSGNVFEIVNGAFNATPVFSVSYGYSVCIHRQASGVITLERRGAGVPAGSPWEVMHTLANTNTAVLYVVADMKGSSGNGKIKTGFGEGLAAAATTTTTFDFLTMPSHSGNITSSGPGTFTGDAGSFGMTNLLLGAGGQIQAKVGTGFNETWAIGLDEDPTLENYIDGDDVKWMWKLCLYNGNYFTRDVVTDIEDMDSGIPYVAGELVRIVIAAFTVRAEKSSDDGTTWSVIRTFPTNRHLAGTVFGKFAFSGSTATINELKGG